FTILLGRLRRFLPRDFAAVAGAQSHTTLPTAENLSAGAAHDRAARSVPARDFVSSRPAAFRWTHQPSADRSGPQSFACPSTPSMRIRTPLVTPIPRNSGERPQVYARPPSGGNSTPRP